jgi:catechol 2,3-dioxygenase-like lactoylglutathione lyase family enzyme
MTLLSLNRISLNVADLAAAVAFYCDALGFRAGAIGEADPALARLLGVQRLRLACLHRGNQSLELTACDPPGDAYPTDRRSNDLWFQHCALVTDDIAAAHAHLAGFAATPISRQGPQQLPGGIIAFKFRDPDGHPLELIQFPAPPPRTQGGIDHSAISVSDTARSIAFYESLGLRLQARQVNAGPAQDSLDNLDNISLDVVSLIAKDGAPHVELLGYRTPRSRVGTPSFSAIAASRLVFTTDLFPPGGTAVALASGLRVMLLRDPDGHAILLEQQR